MNHSFPFARFLLIAALAFLISGSISGRLLAAPTRVACVGDSITFGSGTNAPGFDSYPAQLARMLGSSKWEVRNFGVSGATLLSQGDRPWIRESAYKAALEFQPEVVIIMLGTNDTKPQNWTHQSAFVADYRALIQSFQALPSSPKIFVCRPVPVFGEGNFGINAPALAEQRPLIDSVAAAENATLIDMYAALAGRDSLIPDRVHPNTEGAQLMAKAAYQALTATAFTGSLPIIAFSSWKGFIQEETSVAGRYCRIVLPKTTAPGRPWIWRTEFFGHEPQADVALLEAGYHLGYMDVTNMYGAPAAIKHLAAFHAYMVDVRGLSSKPTLIGLSRGGLFALNFAATYPGKVSSLYLDAPVCDFKSWPGGRGKSKGSPADWTRLKKVYGFADDAEALAYASNPIDNLKPLAVAKIPILSVCGDSDKIVPFEENTGILESRYRQLGGPIQVISKPGVDHHPHSLVDPTPIVEFVVKHTRP